ncbi:MAG: hypothetical protein KKA44_05570 [Alphaproteobacteria bacterium]|nr:hypothetical protein [Alphaproteobacteria bacterium]MBU0865267.1 hypothetical protein [Alphaproteobacteria bacterium]MBU1824431.1 hypothetical protein [Alphaproteobacteria bacterium]
MRTLFVLPLLLSACSPDQSNSAQEREKTKAAQLAETPENQIGRFQYYPPSGEMPAVLLDTVTGCVEVFGKAVSVDNPKDVSWWRSYSDTGVPEVTYVDGQPKEVAGSAPPKRCPQRENQKK